MVRPQRPLSVLSALQRRLNPAIIAAGFIFLDSSPSIDDPAVGVGLLKHRLGARSDCQVLGVCGGPSAQTIFAELQSHDCLRRRLTAATAEAIAEHYRAWDCEPGPDPEIVAREGFATVASCLSAWTMRMSSAPGSISDVA